MKSRTSVNELQPTMQEKQYALTELPSDGDDMFSGFSFLGWSPGDVPLAFAAYPALSTLIRDTLEHDGAPELECIEFEVKVRVVDLAKGPEGGQEVWSWTIHVPSTDDHTFDDGCKFLAFH